MTKFMFMSCVSNVIYEHRKFRRNLWEPSNINVIIAVATGFDFEGVNAQFGTNDDFHLPYVVDITSDE